jgi:hypothetical protein
MDHLYLCKYILDYCCLYSTVLYSFILILAFDVGLRYFVPFWNSENAGLLGLTRVGSRRVVQISAGFMIFFSILGKPNALM